MSQLYYPTNTANIHNERTQYEIHVHEIFNQEIPFCTTKFNVKQFYALFEKLGKVTI
jgi:hypothetical protein